MRRTDAARPLLCALLAVACTAPGPLPVAHDGRFAMGSILEIILVGLPANESETLFAEAYDEVARIESWASRYDDASALSAINRGEPPAELDAELRSLLVKSEHFRDQSGGAFDISVGAWVELWVEAAARNRVPDAAERERVRALTGAAAFAIDGAGQLALQPGVRLDLGAIAKGYAIDRIVEIFEAGETRVPNGYLLNFGQSSYWARGRPADADAWRLLLRNPAGDYAGTVVLRDQALSVSASLGQSSEIEGRRYGHVIDPRSGEPLYRDAQVAVTAPDAAMAEALSTAALVMGAETGLPWIEGLEGCEALWLDAEGERATRGWALATGYVRGEK